MLNYKKKKDDKTTYKQKHRKFNFALIPKVKQTKWKSERTIPDYQEQHQLCVS